MIEDLHVRNRELEQQLRQCQQEIQQAKPAQQLAESRLVAERQQFQRSLVPALLCIAVADPNSWIEAIHPDDRDRMLAKLEHRSWPMTGKIAGFDFGIRTFLTCSEGFKIESPQFFKQSMNAIQKANRELSRKVKGSHNRDRARLNLCRKHEDITSPLPKLAQSVVTSWNRWI